MEAVVDEHNLTSLQRVNYFRNTIHQRGQKIARRAHMKIRNINPNAYFALTEREPKFSLTIRASLKKR
jgi:hypothetical protein